MKVSSVSGRCRTTWASSCMSTHQKLSIRSVAQGQADHRTPCRGLHGGSIQVGAGKVADYFDGDPFFSQEIDGLPRTVDCGA